MAKPRKERTSLTLSRFAGEAVEVGDSITITVSQVQGSGRVRLTITAPPDVLILRDELVGKPPKGRKHG